MSAALIVPVLQGIRAGITFVAGMRGGNKQAAWSAINSFEQGAGQMLPAEVREVAEFVGAGLKFVSKRGMAIDEAKALIRKADAEDRDLTVDEVDAYLAETDFIADRVERKLAAYEALQ